MSSIQLPDTLTESAASKLRRMLSDSSRLIVAPGVYDGISARLAISLGFKAIYMTGAGTSMSRLGWADLGLATQNDMVAQVDMIANLDPSIPLIADADTGYGGPVMVARTTAKYARAGVAAMHLEDQVQEKRCGHLLGKEIVSREVYFSRIKAAVDTREELGLDILIIARTDSRQKYGFEEAYERMRGAVAIGADICFPEAMTSREEAAEMVRRLGDTPCLLNMVANGETPEFSVDQAKDAGFRIMIFPAICFEGAMSGVQGALIKLQKQGKQPLTTTGVRECFNLCGLERCIEIDMKAGGKAYAIV